MGIYIHIPFCISKCNYCDFLSFECTNTQEQYVNALTNEIKAANIAATVDTVYIGGGTPTALPTPLLCEIINEAKKFNLADDAEITVEMNPCTNSYELLSALKSQGVNRLSIGLQAWQDKLLKTLKRAHTVTDFTNTIQAAQAIGINNINIDLMFGLPTQTMEHWNESITQVLALNPTHISTYSLTPAENTPLWDDLETNRLNLPNEETDRAMYHRAIHQLTAAGYKHYELSNFAIPTHESRHNIDCWTRKPYRGLGLGAHSFNGSARWNNTEKMKAYINTTDSPATIPPSIQENYQQLSTQDAMAEFMFLGLRMTEGISPQNFQAQFGIPLIDVYGKKIESLIQKNLLEYKFNNLALTTLGLDLANQVFEAFI